MCNINSKYTVWLSASTSEKIAHTSLLGEIKKAGTNVLERRLKEAQDNRRDSLVGLIKEELKERNKYSQ